MMGGRGERVQEAYVQTKLRAKFLASQCSEKGDVQEFLEGLQVNKEELVQGSNQQQRLPVNHHFITPCCPVQLRISPAGSHEDVCFHEVD